MNLRFVTKQIHAYLDYPVAIALIAMPFILGLGATNPMAYFASSQSSVRPAAKRRMLRSNETQLVIAFCGEKKSKFRGNINFEGLSECA